MNHLLSVVPARPGPSLNRRVWLVAVGGALIGPVRAQTAPPVAPAELTADLPQARLQGSGRLRFMGLRVYDIRLWAGASPVGTQWAGLPLALELEYARKLDGGQIAERSLVEMRRQAEPAADTAERWLTAMKKMFPDVREGDRITGLHLPGQGARFFHNGALRGDVPDSEFARLFFGIWLSPRTSEPALREALLGAGLPR
jgi:Chalcone isomerase-like